MANNHTPIWLRYVLTVLADTAMSVTEIHGALRTADVSPLPTRDTINKALLNRIRTKNPTIFRVGYGRYTTKAPTSYPLEVVKESTAPALENWKPRVSEPITTPPISFLLRVAGHDQSVIRVVEVQEMTLESIHYLLVKVLP